MNNQLGSRQSIDVGNKRKLKMRRIVRNTT